MEKIVPVQNFIGGNFLDCKNYLDSYEPAVGEIWAKIPQSDENDVNLAVEAATKAFIQWSETSMEVRAAILMKIADCLEHRLEEFAVAEARDQGKPIQLARTVDIPRACLNFRHFASTFPHVLNTSHFQKGTNSLNYTIRSPVGIAGLISPWNLPLYLLTFKIAPAIMAGNTVICKPSEMTSVTAWMLCSIFKECGLPDGVVNMVFGTGPTVGEAIVSHPSIRLISFTGSTTTGSHIYSLCAKDFKKISLELGGKNAAVVFADADIQKCISTTIRSSFSNQGEICLATSRIYVENSIYDIFLKEFVKATKNLKIGPSMIEGNDIGALISKEHLEKVKGYVKLAVEEGGRIVCGETQQKINVPAPYQKGYYMLPTVLTNLNDDCRCMQEEIFGPFACISTFNTEEEVTKRVNGVKYGLCATVWTQNMSRFHKIAQKLQVGTVWGNCWLVRDLNMPFGGTKYSGIGREGTHESLEFFTEVKTISSNIYTD